VAGIADGSTFSEVVTNSALSPVTLTVNVSSSETYSGTIAGNLTLVKSGPANQVLAGTNTYTGNTTVNAGTLEFANPSFASNSTVTIASGGILQLDPGVTNSVAGLVLNGVSQPNGLYSAVTSSPYLAGSGSLQVQPAVSTVPPEIITGASGGKFILSWPATNLGWQLQVQTNTLLSNGWVNVPNTTSVDSFTNTINSSVGAVFFRLVYP
jgi:autotransporter-associated beta strand protein